MNHDDKIRNVENIDDIIHIEIFNHNIDSNLYNIIIHNMIYDLYDSMFLKTLCMKDEKCSKRYSR